MSLSLFSTDIAFITYVLVFGASAVACFAVTFKTERIGDPDTRRGLFWLLVSSGLWASAHVAYFLVPTRVLKIVFYEVGLVVGLVAVGAWLYFSSAYTNRILHKNLNLRRIAVAVFLVLVLIKVTNPIHNFYFTAELVSSPFPHLAVQHKGMHWISMGLSYGLAMIGYFMLLEKFNQVSYNTRPLAFLVGVTGSPLVFAIVGYYSPYLLDITYEPIGVAIFAVGVLFVFFDSFQTVQIAGEYDEPIIVLDDRDRIRECNESAREIFPKLKSGNLIGRPLEEILPSLDEILVSESSVLEREVDGKTVYYRISWSPFSAGQEQLGGVVVFNDVTDQREAEKREEFLHSLLRHDVRNKVQIAKGYFELLCEEDLPEKAKTYLEKTERAFNEALDIVEKVRKLRKVEGESVIEEVSLSKVIEEVIVEHEDQLSENGIELKWENYDRKVMGNSLLRELFSNLIENAVRHSGCSNIRIYGRDREDQCVLTVEDDGKGIPDEDKDRIFEKRFRSSETGGTGLGLYLVKEIAESCGGDVEVKDSKLGGARFDVQLQKA